MEQIVFDKQDPDAVQSLFQTIDTAFGVDLNEEKILQLKQFSEFSDYLFECVKGTASSDCVSQKVFYAVRQIITENTFIDKKHVSPLSKLEDIIPKSKRRIIENKLRVHFDISVDIVGGAMWLNIWMGIIAVSSFYFTFSSYTGLTIFTLSVLIWSLSVSFGTVLKEETVGDIVMILVGKNYDSYRKNVPTKNRTEIESILKHIFIKELYLEDKRILGETKLLWGTLAT